MRQGPAVLHSSLERDARRSEPTPLSSSDLILPWTALRASQLQAMDLRAFIRPFM